MRPAFDIAQAAARFGRRLPANSLTTYQKRTLQAIVACRTAALGGHIDACGECGHLRISYNSCRNRHCPKCQGLNKEMWAIQQEEQLLPVPYFHVVFTLPHELNGLCMHNPRFMYGLLLEAGWHTLNSFGNSPKWLGARTAATIVLHTWGQNLSLHPHIHCIVPSGGLRQDGTWQLPKRGNAEFLYPVEAMKEVFRAYFMQHLRSALEQGLLALPKGFPYKRGPYYRWKEALYRKSWVAHTQKPFAGPQNVVQYLARYSHRIAITNHRILDIGQDTVRFAYKDYADGAQKKEMALDGLEFLRRFCLHYLSRGITGSCRRIFGKCGTMAFWPTPAKTKYWRKPWPLWLTRNSSFLPAASAKHSPNNASLARLPINAPAATNDRWLPSKRWKQTKAPLSNSGPCSIIDPGWQHGSALALLCPAAGI